MQYTPPLPPPSPHTSWPQIFTQKERVPQSCQDVIHTVHVQTLHSGFGHVGQAARPEGGGEGQL